MSHYFNIRLKMNHRNYCYYLQYGKVRDVDKFDAARYHAKEELVLQIEKDRDNMSISKLIQATVKDLEWDHFTRQSRIEK